MKRVLITIAILTVFLASLAVAQQQRRGPATQPLLGTQQTFAGTVVSFNATAGTMHPTLLVSDGSVQKAFALGPFWYLAESKFAAAAGDRVTVVSLSCTQCTTGDVVISVANQTNGTTVTLRDAAGLPLWQNASNAPGHGRGMGRGNGPMGGGYGNCNGVMPDMTRKATFEGTVASFTGGPGVGQPQLTLATASGNRVFVPAPYRVVLDAGYTFATGAKLSVVAVPVINDGTEEWVLVSLKDLASGLELTFRDASGYPNGMRGHGRP